MFAAGVAIGAGWQSLVAFVNIGSYYLVGLPLAAVFGFKLKLNATVRHDMPGRCDVAAYLLAFLPQRQSVDSVCAAGDLGRRVDRNGITDCDSVCNPQQNQMAERGTVLLQLEYLVTTSSSSSFLLLFPYSATLFFCYSFSALVPMFWTILCRLC